MFKPALALLLPILALASPTPSIQRRAKTTSTRPAVPTVSPSGAVNYPYTVTIDGDIARSDQDFVDGFALDAISPTEYNLTVDVIDLPQGPYVVSTMGGGPWKHINKYAWSLKTNVVATDLIGAKIEVQTDPAMLTTIGIQVDNTYVGKLSDDGTYWYVDSAARNIHNNENKTRLLGLNSYDGVYALLGRYTVDVADWYIQYGYYPFAATRTFNATGGGRQNAIFIDGFALSVNPGTNTSSVLKINADLKTPITAKIGSGYSALTSYYYAVNSSSPSTTVSADITLPYTSYQLTGSGFASKNLKVAWNKPGSSDFEPLTQKQHVDTCAKTVTAYNVPTVDGQFVLVGY